jgi:Flp pilus assembly pilin Flp
VVSAGLLIRGDLARGAAHGDRDRGASAVEYALLIGLIALLLFLAVTILGTSVRDSFDSAASGFN